MPPENPHFSRPGRVYPDTLAAIVSLFAVASGACGQTKPPGAKDGAAPQDAATETAPVDGASDAGADANDGGARPDADASVDTAPPSPTFEAAAVTTACTGAETRADAPLGSDVTFTCKAAGGALSVAAGVGGTGVVAFTSDPPARTFLLRKSNTLFIDGGPTSATAVTVLADANGDNSLVGDAVPQLGVAFYAQANGGWMREAVPPSLAAAAPSLASARLSADGHVYVLYDTWDDSKLHLRARDAAGTWSAPLTIGDAAVASVVVDAGGLPHVLSLATLPPGDGTNVGVSEWQSGGTTRAWNLKLPRFTGGVLPAAVVADGAIALAIKATDGIHVVISKGDMLTDELLGVTHDVMLTGCPLLSATSGPAVGTSLKCTETGRGSSYGPTIAATSDGTVWIAYVSQIIDRDVTQQCVPFEGTTQCFANTTTDRSTSEIVLRKRTPPPALSSAIAWRAPITGQPGARLMLDARGTNLHLAYAIDDAGMANVAIRYVIFDATKL